MRLARLVPRPVRHRLWCGWERFIAEWNKRLAIGRIRDRGRSEPHNLAGDLIVSITSHPGRFDTLHLTLSCLLDQTVRPDRVILWIAHDDLESLPGSVHALAGLGLDVRACEDFRSFKKLVPAVVAFPTAHIVTADDDIYYPRDWLQRMVEGVDPDQPSIVGHRAVRIVRLETGRLAPFDEWDLDVQDKESRSPSGDLMCEGAGGILYPPGSLHPMVIDHTLFQRLSPKADDLWFLWCARLAGTAHKKVGRRVSLMPWHGSQKISLWQENEGGGNDKAIRALEEELGLLPTVPTQAYSRY